MRRRSLILLAVIATVAIAASLALSKRPPAAAPAATATPAAVELASVDLAQVSPADIDSTLALTGTLNALQQTTLTAQVEGRIASVGARPGDAVSKGDVLARFDTADLERQATVARAQLEKSREQREYNRRQMQRNADLLKQNFISKNAFDSIQSQLQTAEADERASAAQLGVAQQALDKAIVRAPFSGTVGQRAVEPGQHVGINSQLFTLVDLTELELVAAVPAARIAEVRLGQQARFKVEGYPQPFTGTVSRINPTVGDNNTVALYIRVPNPDGVLRSGLFAQGLLVIAQQRQVPSLPRSALRSDGGDSFVLAVESNKLVRRPVKVGAIDLRTNRVEIAAGVAPGTRVLASQAPLTAGTAVKLPAR
ncbi:efflux RND transporter periplasmic adaptor subunit [Chitiniphilus purpureus]|uniref:Efflux RND transporter periplasmic adaptor subunit n=1 Tax=Chitiniphilus purpureus TaxID=2981137 RepID=A0ABY6DS27_9NEIS|nr:efflux RND transporter periplasmic adaptor subunit [Chitiniphilus sp. CD1]UXY17169.1 efflux RND transporter periplasmic adaptor subunit [Chitiniphilus sp. CD1]